MQWQGARGERSARSQVLGTRQSEDERCNASPRSVHQAGGRRRCSKSGQRPEGPWTLESASLHAYVKKKARSVCCEGGEARRVLSRLARVGVSCEGARSVEVIALEYRVL